MIHVNALIVDDEAPARSELRFLLEETGRVENIAEASNARGAVEALLRSKEGTEARTDVIFLDISMPKTSGMELADALHKLKHPPAVVFVTAYSEYALEAFSVDAVDYLMKSVETERLKQALDKVEARLAPSAQRNTVERIPVEKGGRKVFVDVDKIRYIEAKLTPHGFFRVHRGYIVNLDHVEDVEVISSGILQLGLKGIEGKKIPVSRRRVVSLKRALGL